MIQALSFLFNNSPHWLTIAGACIALVALLCWSMFSVPAELRHLPKVSIPSLLWSYATGEVEEKRIKRLLLPFANERKESLVVVYALGRWIVHVLDHNIARDISENIAMWPKEVPPDDLLLWRFVGRKNIILSNGEMWKRQSRIVKAALNRNIPIEKFVQLGHDLFSKIGQGGRHKWDDLSMRYALDVLGSAALGHNFDAISNPHGPFVEQYNSVMEGIASAPYLLFPKLEKIFPRYKVIDRIDILVDKFHQVLMTKYEDRGNDMLTYMLEEPGMSDEEYRDNMVVFFIAGHDTTAGAMSSFVYYLSKHPEIQEKARQEVLQAMSGDSEVTLATLREMHFTQACIRESLRINTPITYTVPRASQTPQQLKDSQGRVYALPARTSVIIDICAIHHNETYWPDHLTFNPYRFMDMKEAETSRIDASLWLPFALGPRQCPARNFAMYELRTIAAMLLKDYKWSLPTDSPHAEGPLNGFSPFALSLPSNLFIDFQRL